MKRTTIFQLGLFGLAFIIFYAGLVIGLTHDPTLGTGLWILAGLLFGITFGWLLRSRKK